MQIMNDCISLNTFSSQQYFNNNANSIILKKSICLVCTTDQYFYANNVDE